MKSQDLSQLQEQINPTPQQVNVKAENQQLKRQVAELKRELGERQDILENVQEAVEAAQPFKSDYKPTRSDKVDSECPVVVHCTDWHIGEVTKGGEVEEFNEFNVTVAKRRVNTFLDKLLSWVELHRHSYECPELVILGTGDWISGDIHYELQVTNEMPAPVQAVESGFIFGNFVRQLAPHFKKIRVEFITLDNHGRLTKKPQKAQGGFNNYAFIVGSVASGYLQQHENVEFNMHPCASKVIDVAGQKYLISHGDGIMGTWGIPFYGLERKKQREAMSRMNLDTSLHFNKMVIGHFHQALNHHDWIIGGSLSGTTAYDHKEGRHCRAHQTAWFTHPKHGEFDWTRFWL